MTGMTESRVRNFASAIDANTLAQAERTAAMPFVHPFVAMMPDAHFGKGSAVGTVLPTRGAVIPAAVGVDIGCGMIAVETRLVHTDIEPFDLAELRKSVESAIPMSAGGYNRKTDRYDFTRARLDGLTRLAAETGVDLGHSGNWQLQLGTLGGGNHFIELCLDERGHVWLFLHSGSRGVGNRIAQRHIKVAQAQCAAAGAELPDRDLAYLTEGTAELGDYLRDLAWAQQFALDNRAEMMDRFVRAVEHWAGVERDTLEIDRVNCHHNYTVVEEHFGEQVWLTRKGAINARAGVRGVIPGSMGTRSYVVRGKGNPESLHSAPHGAGRRFSRTEARRRFTLDDLADRMTGIEYRHGDAWIDEIPDAYKDIDQVMADAADLVEVEHTLRQILNVKGT